MMIIEIALLNILLIRGKEKIEELPCERVLQGFEFCPSFFPRRQIQNPVKSAHKAVYLNFFPLNNLNLMIHD